MKHIIFGHSHDLSASHFPHQIKFDVADGLVGTQLSQVTGHMPWVTGDNCGSANPLAAVWLKNEYM